MDTQHINEEIKKAEAELVEAKVKGDAEAIANLTEKIYQLKRQAKKDAKKK